MTDPTKILRRPGHSPESGAAMVVAIISVVVVTAFAATLLTAVDSEKTGVVLENDRTQALKFAEGALEVAENELITAIANFESFATPPVDDPFLEMSGQYQAGQLGASWTIHRGTQLDAGGVEVAVAAVVTNDPVTGLQQTVEPHTLTATVQVGTSSLRVRRHIHTLKVPIFQFLTYYSSDLEINPGADMTMAGRVHTNANMYLSPGTGLSIDTKYARAAGDYFHRRKDSSSLPGGWIKIKNAVTNNLVTLPSKGDLASLGISSTYGLDSTFTGWDIDGDGMFDDSGEMPPFKNAATDLFEGTFQTGEHGVQPLAHPSIGSIAAYEARAGGDYIQTAPGVYTAVAPGTGTHAKGFYHANADLVILDNKVYNKAGTDITALMPAGFVQNKTIWDHREKKLTTCTQINIGKLGDMDGNSSTLDPCPYFPANGLLFAARSDSAPGNPNGVVLTNGSEINIPAKWNTANYGGASPMFAGAAPVGAFPFTPAQQMGLTVVAPTPVYVHGDYNTKAKKPAAVMTDTINLLSNSWNFTKTSSSLPTASNTTYNVAVITGNSNTTFGHYNGGFENLPRFHENWSGKNCTIQGSFVNTWFSQIATGPWVYGGNYYTAPNRFWSYETMYDSGNLPPFTPMVIFTRTAAWEVSQ